MFNVAKYFSVYYTDLGTIDHVEIRNKAVLQNTIDAKLTDVYKATFTVADDCTINIEKFGFCNNSGATSIAEITSGQSFKWNSSMDFWVDISNN